MADRPYTVLSCSISIDGYLGGPGARRLVLSNEDDLDRVDEVRAGCDAILVGANTVRRDDPRLLVKSARRREARVARGLPPSPMRVTLTTGGDLDPRSRIFTCGVAACVVYCASPRVGSVRQALGARATVVDAGDPVELGRVVGDLATRGVGRLMVEGGGCTHAQFLADGLVDELQVVVAPLLIGDARAPRFVPDGRFPWPVEQRARLIEVRPIGDVVLLRYGLSDRCDG